MVKRKPIYKLGRKLGAFVHEKCQTQKFALSEARKNKNFRRRVALSDYGKQLLEKQKVRFAFGITEKQLRRYVHESMKSEDTNTELYRKLQMRLDSVVHLLGLAPTQPAARQLVSHGHITVNGRKVTIPSYACKKGDIVAVREGSKQKAVFALRAEEIASFTPESWLSFDAKKLSGKIEKLPEYDPTSTPFDLKAVFEFYTK